MAANAVIGPHGRISLALDARKKGCLVVMEERTIQLVEAPQFSRFPLLTTKDLAARTGTKPATWSVLRSKNLGPPYVVIAMGAIRYRQEDVDAWLQSRRVTDADCPAANLPRRRGGPGRPPGRPKASGKRRYRKVAL